MNLAPTRRLRLQLQRLHHAARGPHWFPHVPLALLLGLGGLWLLRAELGVGWSRYAQLLMVGSTQLQPRLLPPLLIGGGMLTMALGLLLRSRLAWTMALLLEVLGAASLLLDAHAHHGHVLLAYFVLVLAALLAAWRQFDRSSVAASTLFALTSVAMLLLYATFGSYYLGADFKPQITDLVTALYYAMVTMSTVGYGDITPQTTEAKLFTVSVIVLGVAVFATSLTAVIAPMVSRSLQRIVNRKANRMKRENHFVVIGNSPLAINTWRELAGRGQPVTRVLRQAPDGDVAETTDVVVGDPGSVDVLRQAGADKANAVLAMLDDDSENAFVVLAARELGGGARTVAAVNDARHLGRIKLVQPDVVIAPQILGGELAAMLMCGEEVTSDFVMQRVFQPGRQDRPAGA
ncbi:voltage-gated potassium channel protein [Fulvimonas sp. R45]|uniref:voltage-gated potassium channel protein n=1 Tax=Fulvimonas sp. R45 TaxID=3045937 RepID=UPI00265D9872|nr:voltage-gated potassium channel protein [Fulvimonas sp. R45]MDO1528542.1 voltage-gated potassium channel protein [Fulvimonas sp. R45]